MFESVIIVLYLQSIQKPWVNVHSTLILTNFHPLSQVSSYLLNSNNILALMNYSCELGKKGRVESKKLQSVQGVLDMVQM